VNGAARLRFVSYRPVELTGKFEDKHGHRYTVVEAGLAEFRARVPQFPQADPIAPRYVDLAAQHKDVRDGLALLANPEPAPGWDDLYKLWEIVRDNVSSNEPSKKARAAMLMEKGFVDAADLQAMHDNSCHPDAPGDEARHARWGGPPPDRILSLAEGRDIARQLVASWLDSML